MMNVCDYDKYIYISWFNELKDIEGYFRDFDKTKDKISDFRLMFIFPSGEFLLMPYTKSDKAKDVLYDHVDYMTVALELILKKLNINRNDFIKNNIIDVDKYRDEFISMPHEIQFAILGLNIAIFYNCQTEDGKYTCFDKPRIFTERQKKSIALLKRPFENEGYEFKITTFKDDNSIKDRDEINIKIDEEQIHVGLNIKSYYKAEKDGMDFDTVCNLLNIDLEQTR